MSQFEGEMFRIAEKDHLPSVTLPCGNWLVKVVRTNEIYELYAFRYEE